MFALLGVGQGAMYAAMGLGLVVTYRGTGIVNLAFATMAAFPAMAYHRLVTTGDLVFPWVVLPAELSLGDRVHPAVAFVLAVIMGVVMGALAHLLVFRPLRFSSALTRLVASIGLTVVVQAIGVYRFGAFIRRPKAILPDRTLHVLHRGVFLDRFLLAGVVVVMAIGVGLFLNRTLTGLATRAAAESEKGAVLLGYSPERLALANGLLSAFLGAVAGILLSPIAGVGPFSYSFFVVPALASALAGRLKYLKATVVVAFALGMFQSLLVRVKDYSFMPVALRNGFDEGVPFLLIVVVLALLGKRLPQRGALVEPRQPTAAVSRHMGWALPLLVLAAFPVLVFADRTLRLPLIISLVMAVLMLSQVVLTGYLGQISLAQLTFAGMAGFMVAKLTTELGWPVPWAPLVAVAVTMAVGVLVSLPATRIRGVQLALVTLAFAIAAEQLLFRNGWFTGPSATARVATPRLFGVDLGVLGKGEFPQRPFALVVLTLTALALAAVANLRRSGTGRRMLAVRVNEAAAAACGVDVGRAKLVGAGLGAALAGTSGVMLAYASVVISPAGYESRVALSLLALGFLGGIARLGGALVAGALVPGGIAFTVLAKITGVSSPELQFFLAGVGLLLVTRWAPDGVAGLLDGVHRRVAERLTQVGADVSGGGGHP